MRPRKKDKHLPRCVFLRHGAYYLVRDKRWIRLAEDLRSALVEYARLQEQKLGGMPELIEQALPFVIRGKAKSTVAQYQTAARRLQEVFKDFAPNQVLPKHVAQLRREMADTPNMTNRVITVLRLVFDYALEEQLVDANPCTGIKRLTEAKRTRLITPEEFRAIYAQAGDRLQVIMDLLYLTGQRVVDVLNLRVANLREDGIYFKQGKTGAQLAVAWNPELRKVVARAKALQGDVRALTLLVNKHRKAPDYRSVALQFDTARKAAGVGDVDMRDIRAMAATHADSQGHNPTALLGHTSPTMTKRYLREKVVPTVEGPSIATMLGRSKKK